jgi:hypothetical protein
LALSFERFPVFAFELDLTCFEGGALEVVVELDGLRAVVALFFDGIGGGGGTVPLKSFGTA